MTLNPKVSLVVGILAISFYPIFIKLADEPAFSAAFYRIFIGWLALLPYCVVKGLLKINRKDLLLSLLTGLTFAADVATWNQSMSHISATVSTLLANFAPVWVGLISLFVLRKPSGWLFWLGTFVSLAGMVILVGYEHIIHLEINIGVWLALLTSFFYSMYILLSKNVLQRVNSITFMFYSMIGGGIGLLTMSLWQGNDMLHFGSADWLYFIGMGLICQLLGWLSLSYALKFLAPTKVSVTLLSQTVTTGLLAVWFLNETLGLAEVVGSAVVLGGIAITFLKPSAASK